MSKRVVMLRVEPTWRWVTLALGLVLPLAGCGSASDMLSKDAEWFSRPTRIFEKRDLTVSSGPLTQRTPVAADELIGADGACAGMAPVAPAGAEGGDPAAAPAAPQPTSAGVALENPECTVVRSLGQPDNMNISANERGERYVVLTYMRGPRPGIYQFTAGRLSSIERGPEPPPVKKPVRSAKKKKSAA